MQLIYPRRIRFLVAAVYDKQSGAFTSFPLSGCCPARSYAYGHKQLSLANTQPPYTRYSVIVAFTCHPGIDSKHSHSCKRSAARRAPMPARSRPALLPTSYIALRSSPSAHHPSPTSPQCAAHSALFRLPCPCNKQSNFDPCPIPIVAKYHGRDHSHPQPFPFPLLTSRPRSALCPYAREWAAHAQPSGPPSDGVPPDPVGLRLADVCTWLANPTFGAIFTKMRPFVQRI